jgi:hypothetical protein
MPLIRNRDYGRGDPSRRPSDLYEQKLALSSPTSGGHSVDIVRSRTKFTEKLLLLLRHEDVWGGLLISALVGGAVSSPGRFNLVETFLGTHWIGGWVGEIGGLEDAEKLTLQGLELWPLCSPAHTQ